MKQRLKRFASAVLPDRVYASWMSVRARKHESRFLAAQGLMGISAAMVNRYGATVLHGPFAGMQYPPSALAGRHGAPKLLGSYECELHPLFAGLRDRQYRKIVDIGCAEGYYAVGLALLTGGAVHAFDTDPQERKCCARMAELNGVARRVRIASWCGPETLCALTRNKRCFVLSDCEGFELELFNLPVVSCLSRSDLIIEVHERPGVNVYNALCERFEETHAVRTVLAEDRDESQYRELDFLGTDASTAVAEFRVNGRRWIHLISREVASLSG